MFCEECGTKLNERATVCSKCGLEVSNKKEKRTQKNGLKTASIVLGIIGIILSFSVILSPISIIITIVGLILGLCALKKGKNIAGIVLCSIGIFVSIVAVVTGILLFRHVYPSLMEEFNNEITNSDYDFDSIDLDALYASDVPITYVIEKIEKTILDKMYIEDEELIETVYEEAEEYYNLYNKYYGYTKEEFLLENGFKNEQDFIDYLKNMYKRNKYYAKYVSTLITEEEIEEYYNQEVYGDVNSKHILVQVSEEYTEIEKQNSKNLAYTIIAELNSGASFDDVKEKYKDYITYEELGYKAYDATLEYAYMKEMRDLEVGNYSSEPIETSYGYHIVYKIAQKEKPALEEVKNTIVEILVTKKQSEDDTLYLKSVKHLIEEAGFTFEGTVYEEEYQEYIDMYLY